MWLDPAPAATVARSRHVLQKSPFAPDAAVHERPLPVDGNWHRQRVQDFTLGNVPHSSSAVIDPQPPYGKVGIWA
jgi:hypothetical protein